MKKTGSMYAAAYDLPYYPTQPRRTIMIAAAPRSGSTYLGLELWRTGLFGAPLEYLNLARRSDMLPRLGDGDYRRYWSNVQSVRTSTNGVFAYKAFVSDFSQIGIKCPELLDDVCSDHVIYLERRDKVGQAISFAKAMQSGQWYSIVKPDRPAFYDTAYIDQLGDQLRAHDQSWERIFKATSTKPLRIFYEDFISDQAATIRRIFNFCEVDFDPVAEVDLPELTVQRDEESERWRSTYLTEKTAGARSG